MSDLWSLVHAERAALIADLETLDDQLWSTPSLCGGWSVHDVAAHLVDSARTTRIGFVLSLARAGFSFDRHNERGMRVARGADPAETLRRLRATSVLTATPPAPLDSRLVEEVVHGEDIRRPLGVVREYPTEVVMRALATQLRLSQSLGGAKELVSQVSLHPVDADGSFGSGPRVDGPALSLLLVCSGRATAVDELVGPGLDVVRRFARF